MLLGSSLAKTPRIIGNTIVWENVKGYVLAFPNTDEGRLQLEAAQSAQSQAYDSKTPSH